MPPRTLLATMAHPDDETFAIGGTLARLAQEGWRVVLACATRGEMGEISDPALATPDNLGEVREAELRAAAACLGVAELRFLGFRDSGMAGTPANDDPRAFHHADPPAATRTFVALLRDVQPELVITHDPTGGYGHPDHVACCRYTTLAFDLAGDPAQFPEAGPPWQPARLYYTVLARSVFRRLAAAMKAHGVDPGELGGPDVSQFGLEDDAIDLVLDVRAHLAAKQQAFEAHRTQFGGDNVMRRVPPEVTQMLIAHEWFVQARPPRTDGVLAF